MKRRILIVDDDMAVLLTLKAVLELHEFEVEDGFFYPGSFAENAGRSISDGHHRRPHGT